MGAERGACGVVGKRPEGAAQRAIDAIEVLESEWPGSGSGVRVAWAVACADVPQRTTGVGGVLPVSLRGSGLVGSPPPPRVRAAPVATY